MRLAPSKPILLFLLVCVLSSLTSLAFSEVRSDVHQSTKMPSDARFEIIQSPLAVRWTFRLDRYTGHVSQLVKTQDEGFAWEPMLVYELPEVSKPSTPRFVIFTSGLAARFTLLMDFDTGQTWVLRNIGSDFHVWQPFER